MGFLNNLFKKNDNDKNEFTEYLTKDNNVKLKIPKKFVKKDVEQYDFYASYEEKIYLGIYTYDLKQYKGFTDNRIIYEQVTILSKTRKLQVYKNTSIKKYDDKTIKTIIYSSKRQGYKDNLLMMSTIQFNQISDYIVYIIQTCPASDYEKYYEMMINNLEHIKYKIDISNIENISNNINTNELKENAITNNYEIPEGGDFNIYINYNNNLNLDKIESYFKSNNKNVEIDVEKNNNDMWIGINSKENNANIALENYGLEDDLKDELLQELQESNDKEKSKIMEHCNSNYYVKSRSTEETILLYYLILYFFEQISDVLIYDSYNGVYLSANEIKDILKNKENKRCSEHKKNNNKNPDITMVLKNNRMPKKEDEEKVIISNKYEKIGNYKIYETGEIVGENIKIDECEYKYKIPVGFNGFREFEIDCFEDVKDNFQENVYINNLKKLLVSKEYVVKSLIESVLDFFETCGSNECIGIWISARASISDEAIYISGSFSFEEDEDEMCGYTDLYFDCITGKIKESDRGWY